AEYPMDITQNNDVFVEVSGLLKALAVNLMKIANDFRLMNSGPYGGLGEIKLAPMQLGSTIMPGKVNPVIPEMIMQTAMKVIANDSAITTAAFHGEFELNAFLPLIADSLLESLSLLINSVNLFRTKCVELVEPDRERCNELLNRSYAFATAYTKVLGYDRVSEIIAENVGNNEEIKIAVIFLSTDIANIIASYSDFTDLTSIRYQVAVIIPCLIIAINSCVYLYTNAKTDKNINDITKQ
ncbi:MAG: aspartate ammonia-lyase, partial [Anaerocolumna sp.]|nr:aspartate ammonia-lyase [Anaerocolumna sp.]